MTFLVWRDYLETGLPEIDTQHRRLVELVNTLGPSLAGAACLAPEARRALLAELVDYTGTHFRDEEAVMAREGMDAAGVTHHHATHARFAALIDVRTAALDAGEPRAGDALLSLLSSWLLLHILGEDQAMARQVKLLRAGLSPAEARLRGRGSDLSPDPAALSHAMVDVYVLLSRQNREIRVALSEVRRQRETIAGHNAKLERTVQERTRSLEAFAKDLTRARDDAQSADRAKGRILATVGHELRTPLNAIAGHVHALRSAGLPEPAQESAIRIARAGERLTEVVESVMAFAGDDAPPEPCPFRPGDLLARAADRARMRALPRGLDVEAFQDPAVPERLSGDPAAVEQVLRRLVDNAAKYTERGAIRLAVRLVGSPAGLARLRFEVADTGIGIDEAGLAALFDAFGQRENHLVRRHEGLGLGLAIAHKLATRLGGTLRAASRPGSGTTFSLEADFAIVPPAPRAGPQAGDPPAEGWLAALAEQLAQSDARVLGLVARMPPTVRARLGASAPEIERFVNAFDFENAARALQASPAPPLIPVRALP